jgi:hypothetical protein
LSNVLNDSNKPPVSNGNPRHPDAQGGISSPFAPRNLPFSQHPALDNGRAGNAPVITPLMPLPDSAPPTRDTGTNRNSR